MSNRTVADDLRKCSSTNLKSARAVFLDKLYFNILWKSTWGDIAPVILGSDEQDGQRADDLYRAVVDCCSEASHGCDDFHRKDALALIEDWREEALRLVFSAQAVGADAESLTGSNAHGGGSA